MKCMFCLENDLSDDESIKNCSECKSIFITSDDEIIAFQFNYKINDNEFIITWLSFDNNTTVHKYADMCCTLKHIVDIPEKSLNPFNVKQRLPTILIFL